MIHEFDAENVENRFPASVLETLVDRTYEFYGVDGCSFCIGYNGARIVLEAVEDPGDGYRSYMACFKTSLVDKIFFRQPIAYVHFKCGGLSTRCDWLWDVDDEFVMDKKRVMQEQKNAFSGWILEDVEDGHVWLTVGTDYGEDYYPCFTFRYEPKRDV